jgi:predicted ATPase
MLTRLRVSGFKNLVDVDVHFGPFTCIAGANGTGKSNLFDAIQFLSSLTDMPMLEAALRVRSDESSGGDVRSLFHRVGAMSGKRMTFEVEMMVPAEGEDDLGQAAKATRTFLRYSLELRRRAESDTAAGGPFEVLREELTPITKGDTAKHLPFAIGAKAWRESVATGVRRRPYISTEGDGPERVIKVHQDGGSRGRPQKLLARTMPRTGLSRATATESPTASQARQEMQFWRLLQLEPSALRQPDPFNAPTKLGRDGAHLAATLHRLAAPDSSAAQGDSARVYAVLANRLSELVDEIQAVSIDEDEKRELLSLLVRDRGGTDHPALSLSDGTLRFLALAVLELDPLATGVLCLEEPENGIHPARIPAMLRLLQDIAVSIEDPVGPDNPLRQVIVNTHSPAVVAQVPEDSLIVADLAETIGQGARFQAARFRSLSGTWRDKVNVSSVPKGRLLAYLNPIPREEEASGDGGGRRRRVVDRPDVQPYLFPMK